MPNEPTFSNQNFALQMEFDARTLEKMLTEELQIRGSGSKLGFAEERAQIELDFKQSNQDLQTIQQMLDKQQQLTDKMVGILDNFEDRLSALEGEIIPVHRDTTKLKTIEKNIEETITGIKNILAVFSTAKKVEPRILEGPKEDLDGYLETIDKVGDAMSFLLTHRNFNSMPKAYEQLKTIRQSGLQHLETVFSKLLDTFILNLTYDLTKDSPPEMFPLIKPEGIKQMQKILKRFVAFNHQNYVMVYTQKRSKEIEIILLKLNLDKIRKDDGNKKGSHLFISFIRFYLVLLQSERRLAEELVESEQREEVFSNIIAFSIDNLLEMGESIIKQKKQLDKGFGICPLLDIWHVSKSLLKSFAAVLKNSGGYQNDLEDLVKKFGISAKKMIEEFDFYLKSDGSAKQVSIPPDGTVFELTSNVCVLLKRLYEHQQSFEELLADTQQKTSLEVYVLRTISELRNNLSGRAKKEKKAMLSNIFLLNNYHYILKTVKSSELWMVILRSQSKFSSEYETLINEQRDLYKAAWRTAAVHIEMDKLKDLKNKQSLSSKERGLIKTAFKEFNNAMEELLSSLRNYFIPDPDLRKILCNDTRTVVLDSYFLFYDSFANSTFSQNKQKYIKYTKDQMDEVIGALFDGQSATRRK